jgi:hypothetical protein
MTSPESARQEITRLVQKYKAPSLSLMPLWFDGKTARR